MEDTIQRISPITFVVHNGFEEKEFRAFLDHEGVVNVPLIDVASVAGNENVTAERDKITRKNLPKYKVEGIRRPCMCVTLDEFLESKSKSTKTEGKNVYKWLLENKQNIINTCNENFR